MKKITTAFLFALFVFQTQAQLAPAPNQDLPDNSTLERIFREKFETDRQRAEKIAKEKGIQLRQEFANGAVIEFVGFDTNGNMLFDKTDNLNAAKTIATDKIWPGGSAGTSLTGAGMTNRLGVWDGGGVRVSHQEFQGRVVQTDGQTLLSDHATHVAGTMVAAGINSNAKGMSYEAPLKAFDWNNDASEMTTAASQGMLVSNHSYGSVTGWNLEGSTWKWYGDQSISSLEDWKFGFYDDRAEGWDQIALNNPYYLICKSAGNDRGDGPNGHSIPKDGGSTGYDCISTYGTAKNILTVGAVNKITNGWTKTSDVVMSSFSGWGPTDDGRIKPDVVAAGVNVFSTVSTSNSAYDTYSGTSMASPNASGSLILVQQHYYNVKGTFMRSATLKGLAIHTADEAGATGPDYKFGWGLLNIAKAVQTINDQSTNMIAEKTLNNNATYTQGITTDGAKPLRITICWTDRPGNSVFPQLDPTTPMLVNDLDIRLTRQSDNTIFQPYVLNPASPGNTATTGDNIRDNVEQIYLSAPAAGNYILTVFHKGSLVGSAQNYSLFISGQISQPTAIISVPNRDICIGNSVTFIDASSGSPSLRRWYFPGGTPSTSTAVSPTVNYSTAGKYPVALFVSNDIGSDSVYYSNYITVGGQTLPFTETFETNSPTTSLWQILNPNNDTTWRYATVSGVASGNRAMCMPFYNTAGTGRLDNLISPVLSFRGHTNVSLSFRYAYTRDPAFSTDSLRVFISTNCGSTYTRLASYGESGSGNFRTAAETTNYFTPADSSEWKTITLSLGAYNGLNNLRLRFEGYNGSSNNLYIDNISITGMPQKPIANFYTANKTVCAGEPVIFYDSTQNFPASWEWTFDGVSVSNSTDQNPIVIYTQAGVYTVKLKTTNATGADSITKTNYITVLPTSTKPNLRNVGAISFCKGDSSMIITDSTNVNSFLWYRNNTLINGENTPILMVKDSGSYTVRTLNANGCGALSDPLLINVFSLPPKPVITSNLTAGVLCEGGTATLTSSASSNNQWYKDNSILSNETSNTYSTQEGGSFTVRVNNGMCYSESNATIITVKPKPQTSSITGNDSVTVGSTHGYTVTGSVGSTFNWVVTNGSVISGNGNSSVAVKWSNQVNVANVRVQETASSGCKGELKSLNVVMFWHTGIAEEAKLKNVQVYPNPVQENIFIELLNDNNETTAYAILKEITGREVLKKNYSLHNGQNKLELNLGDLRQGVYILELQSGKRSVNVKLILE